MVLTGESVRVSLKKDYRKLVTEGTEYGFCVVEYDGQQSAITLPNGVPTRTHWARPPSPLLSFCLDAQRFARLPEDERRSFLFGLMNLRTDGPAVIERLLAKGLQRHQGRGDQPAPARRIRRRPQRGAGPGEGSQGGLAGDHRRDLR